MSSRKFNHPQSGFSFAQTLIVLAVIALLLVATLAGARLYHQTRLQANAIQVSILTHAVQEFKNRYGAWPGDFGDSETTAFSSFGQAVPALPGCDNNPVNSCRGGNMDQIIGRSDRAIYAALNTNNAADIDSENSLFWYHLKAADLYGSTSSEIPTTTAIFGDNLPKSPSQGGFLVKAMGGFDTARTGDLAAPDGLAGLYVVYQADPVSRADRSFVITPHEAAQIDRKFDDGQPLSGKIMARGINTAPNTPDGCRLSATRYNEDEDAALSCYMIFELNRNMGS